jgi:hypothetical protein
MDRYYYRLLPFFRQFLFIPNRNKFMDRTTNCPTTCFNQYVNIYYQQKFLLLSLLQLHLCVTKQLNYIQVIKYTFYRASWLKQYIFRRAVATCPVRIVTTTVYPDDFPLFPQSLHGQMSQTWPRRFLHILFNELFAIINNHPTP